MASVCLYFQVHQPYRLRRYSVFDTDFNYFDDEKNAEICRKVSERCYLPANAVVLDCIRRHEGRFKVAYSLSGTVIEQFEQYAPEVIASFQELAATGCVEFLDETYYHSLAFLYSRDEFREQVEMHRAKMKALFGQEPRVFRNSELIYSNDLGHFVAHMGYDGILAEGADQVLGHHSANHLYRPPHATRISLLLRNYRLSDDIAFRFSNRGWEQWPLTADKFAGWVDQINLHGQVCNLFMDYETLGEHQDASTGILEFLRHLPNEILNRADNDFATPSEIIARYQPSGELDIPQAISWADEERDLSAWLGNAMQSNAMNELFKIEGSLKKQGDPRLLADWRRLSSSDHFYYMCTKYWADADVHRYFSPYESPYDSYINYMNVLDNIQSRLQLKP